MRDYKFDFATAQDVEVLQVPTGYIRYYECQAGGGIDPAITVQSMGGGWNIKLRPGEGARIPRTESGILLTNSSGNPMSGIVKLSPDAWSFESQSLQGTVNVVDGGKSRTLSGVAFSASGNQAAVAGQVPAVQLWNPSLNKRLIVPQIICSGATGASMNVVIRMANAAFAGGAIATAVSKLSGGSIGVGEVRAVSGAALPAGAGQIALFGMPANCSPYTYRFTEPVVLLPGTGIFVGHFSPNVDISATFECVEEAV